MAYTTVGTLKGKDFSDKTGKNYSVIGTGFSE